MPRIITLTTDFGDRDPYVASMKGVILGRCPDAVVVDLSHAIPPQDVLEAAYFIAEASQWYPEGTIHCVVVDPGVGTARLPIVAAARGQYFVCPDNGLLTLVAKRSAIDECRIITDRKFMLERISATFHGRDMFAPAAACLARGVPIEEAGERLLTMTLIDIPPVQRSAWGVSGVIVHIDRFGNAISNIARRDIEDMPTPIVACGDLQIHGLSDTYGDVEEGHPLALFSSGDYLEIAVHRGNAAARFGLVRGSRVDVR